MAPRYYSIGCTQFKTITHTRAGAQAARSTQVIDVPSQSVPVHSAQNARCTTGQVLDLPRP